MGLRREARELALQMLYALDSNSSVGLRETLQIFREEQSDISGRVREFAEGLVQGVHAERETIDEAIKARSKNWSLTRMPRVDRTENLKSHWLAMGAKAAKDGRGPTRAQIGWDVGS